MFDLSDYTGLCHDLCSHLQESLIQRDKIQDELLDVSAGGSVYGVMRFGIHVMHFPVSTVLCLMLNMLFNSSRHAMLPQNEATST